MDIQQDSNSYNWKPCVCNLRGEIMKNRNDREKTTYQNSSTQKENKKHKTKNSYKGAVIGLSIATGILGLSTLGFGISYGVSNQQATNYSTQLENIYKKNYYELVDAVNTADMNISKLLVSNSADYQTKMLGDLAQGAKEMQSNIASLPLSSDNIAESVRFINQMSGYTQTLQQKLADGGTLTENDLSTLNDMHESLTEMKKYLNQMSEKMIYGYSILQSSNQIDGDYDVFTLDFAQIKADDTEYPTMIYDGPFADSVVNQEVKGLSGAEIGKEDAYKIVDSYFKNIANLQYQGQTNGKFKTYNFMLLNSDNQKLYVQITKMGGKILTVSGNVESDIKNISSEQAEKLALDFAKNNGVENGTVVWKEELNSQEYFNIAPVQDDVILYPDLVKVKVDLENGNIIGYDAMSYFINHTNRNLSSPKISKETAKANISDSFAIVNERLVLAPLDFNRQVLCWEFECEKDGATYYFYINANSNVEENILKVVKTNDSSKLM